MNLKNKYIKFFYLYIKTNKMENKKNLDILRDLDIFVKDINKIIVEYLPEPKYLLLSVSYKGVLSFYDFKTGHIIRTIDDKTTIENTHGTKVQGPLTIAKKILCNNNILYILLPNRIIRVYDTNKQCFIGRIKQIPEDKEITSMTITHNGLICVGVDVTTSDDQDDSEIRVYEPVEEQEGYGLKFVVKKPNVSITSMVTDFSGRLIIGNKNGEIEVLNFLDECKSIGSIKAHEKRVDSLSVIFRTNILFSTSKDGFIIQSDLGSLEVLEIKSAEKEGRWKNGNPLVTSSPNQKFMAYTFNDHLDFNLPKIYTLDKDLKFNLDYEEPSMFRDGRTKELQDLNFTTSIIVIPNGLVCINTMDHGISVYMPDENFELKIIKGSFSDPESSKHIFYVTV